jgi:hypothetical protein
MQKISQFNHCNNILKSEIEFNKRYICCKNSVYNKLRNLVPHNSESFVVSSVKCSWTLQLCAYVWRKKKKDTMKYVFNICHGPRDKIMAVDAPKWVAKRKDPSVWTGLLSVQWRALVDIAMNVRAPWNSCLDRLSGCWRLNMALLYVYT